MILSPTNPLSLVLAALTLSLAAVVAWLGGSVAAYWIAAVLVLIAALIPQLHPFTSGNKQPQGAAS